MNFQGWLLSPDGAHLAQSRIVLMSFSLTGSSVYSLTLRRLRMVSMVVDIRITKKEGFSGHDALKKDLVYL
jgi:hypothetical protein